MGDVLTLIKGKDGRLIKLRDIVFASLAFPICMVSSPLDLGVLSVVNWVICQKEQFFI